MKFPIPVKYYLLAVIIITPYTHAQVQPGWEILSSGIGFGIENLYFLDSQIGFSTIDHDGVRAPLIRTSNSGLSWNFVYSGDGYVRSIHFPTRHIGYISYNENEPKILRSTDLGETWEDLYSPLNFWVTSIFFTDSFTGFAVGGLNGGTGAGRIAKTTDGGATWSVTTFISSIRSIQFTSPDTGYAIGGDQSSPRIYKTMDAGLTWNMQNAPSGVGTLLQVSFANNNIGYIVSRRSSPYLGYIIKTENGGLNWYIQYSIQDTTLRSVSAVDEETAYVVGDYGTILKTINGGFLWYLQESQTSEILRSVFFVDSLSGYASGGSYIGTPTHVILKTTTGGEPIIPVELTSFTANVEGNNVILIWTTATELNNMGFELFRNGKKIAFIEGMGTTTESQSYSYQDKNLQPGIFNYRLEQIDFDGTRTESGELTIHFTIPETFSLEQNYPNPFNPTTVVNWYLPIESHVSLKIYDILGNELTTLVSEVKQAGVYEVEFDSNSITPVLSSGIYFYRLQAGSYIETKKMVLLR